MARVTVLTKRDSGGDYKNQPPFYDVESDHSDPRPNSNWSPELSFPPDSHLPAVARSPDILTFTNMPTG